MYSGPSLHGVLDLLARIAPTSIPVLVLGETGTGKELTTEWIHARSRRADRPLIRVNCAGLTDSMVESELFGHERGAFTGAVQTHQGLFEAADGGTLFLDEVGELPARTQAKLLRVLESGEFARVGSTQLRRVDVRIIAATHRDLAHWAELGRFRQDLLFRLNGFTLEIPPLRERRAEIAPLARLFLAQSAERLNRLELSLSEGAVRALEGYAWPGNIRELRSTIERAAAICPGSCIQPELLALRGARAEAPHPTELPDARDVRSRLRAYERAQILAVLEETGGNQTRAAARLGVSRRTLTNKLNAYRIARPRKRDPNQPAPPPSAASEDGGG